MRAAATVAPRVTVAPFGVADLVRIPESASTGFSIRRNRKFNGRLLINLWQIPHNYWTCDRRVRGRKELVYAVVFSGFVTSMLLPYR